MSDLSRAPALEKTLLADADGVSLHDVRCRCRRSNWSPPEESPHHSIVFVRRGCFRRRADGADSLLDPVSVYFERRGEEQQIAHPCDGGDACTLIVLPDELAAELWRELAIPASPVLTSAEVDLAHRILLAAAIRNRDSLELAERVASLVATVRSRSGRRRARPARLATAAARRRTVDSAREAIAADPSVGLVELADLVATSPHHLSRIFRAETGETISRYRNRVRVRLTLERLAQGDRRLARIAAELGFADQAHLARVFRSEVGATPSALRARFLGNH
jgi:AraC-like DNA-binding protein